MGLSSQPSMVDHPFVRLGALACASSLSGVTVWTLVWFISWEPIACPGPGMPVRSLKEPPRPLVAGVQCLRWWTLGRPLLDIDTMP